MGSEKRHFAGLDELRALCALGVVVFHIETLKKISGQFSFAELPVITGMGYYGVRCFYVLSGFLVAYLLLEERQTRGSVSLSSFYLKRFCRIAPIYYLVVLFTFFIFPSINPLQTSMNVDRAYTWPNLGLHLAFLPQVGLEKYPLLIGATQLWTIGVEMQFYLLFPLLFLLGRRNLPLLFFICYFGFYFFRLFYRGLSFLDSPFLMTGLNFINEIVAYIRIQPMIVGAFAGWILHAHQTKILKVVYSRTMQIFILGTIATFYTIFPSYNYPFFQRFTPEPFVFSILILNLCGNPHGLIHVRSKFLNQCGKFSYGIYVYHLIFIEIVLGILLKYRLFESSSFLFNLILYSAVFSTTLLTSWVSFRFLEKPILKICSKRVSGHVS